MSKIVSQAQAQTGTYCTAFLFTITVINLLFFQASSSSEGFNSPVNIPHVSTAILRGH